MQIFFLLKRKCRDEKQLRQRPVPGRSDIEQWCSPTTQPSALAYNKVQTVLRLKVIQVLQKQFEVTHMSSTKQPEILRNKVHIMNSKILLSVAAAALITLTGCGTSPTNAQVGTGVGAVAGGVLGNAVFGSTLGTVGGAAAGALIGNEVGKKQ